MTSSVPILYSFRRCPYAMRARFALYSAKISHEHREIELKNKPLEMLDISPKGTVPVLQLEDGRVIEESLDIMNFALSTPNLSLEETALIKENDTTFKKALDRYKYPGRYPEEADVNYQDNCEAFLKKLEERLNPFLSGDTQSLIDMALFPFVRQFSLVNPDRFNDFSLLNLKKWLDSFISSNLFQRVMERHPLWSGKERPILIVF